MTNLRPPFLRIFRCKEMIERTEAVLRASDTSEMSEMSRMSALNEPSIKDHVSPSLNLHYDKGSELSEIRISPV